MKPTLRERLKQVLLPLYKRANINISPEASPYCTNWASKFPEESKRGILFVGKATNGWDNGHIKDLDAFFNDPHFLGNTERMRQDHTGQSKGFNPNRSAYRRMIRNIGEYIYGKEWYDYIAWTNLYKFAPCKRGNPHSDLRRQQLSACKEILAQEIDILDPKIVIFFTSGWETEFISYLSQGQGLDTPLHATQTPDGKVKITLYEKQNRFFILTSHPQGKQEKEMFNKIKDLIKTYLPPHSQI